MAQVRREVLEDRNPLKLRSLDSSCPLFLAMIVFGDSEPKCSKCYDRKAKMALDLETLESLRAETEGKLHMLASPRKPGPTSLFKEVRVFKVPAPRIMQQHATLRRVLRRFLFKVGAS